MEQSFGEKKLSKTTSDLTPQALAVRSHVPMQAQESFPHFAPKAFTN